MVLPNIDNSSMGSSLAIKDDYIPDPSIYTANAITLMKNNLRVADSAYATKSGVCAYAKYDPCVTIIQDIQPECELLTLFDAVMTCFVDDMTNVSYLRELLGSSIANMLLSRNERPTYSALQRYSRGRVQLISALNIPFNIIDSSTEIAPVWHDETVCAKKWYDSLYCVALAAKPYVTI